MISPAQIREARELLRWSTHDLAREAGLAVEVVASVEAGTARGTPQRTLHEIKSAVERWGIAVPTDPAMGVTKRVGRRPSQPLDRG